MLLALAVGAAYWLYVGRLTPFPVVHDEAAYLLQAELFAQGRWTAPAPRLPEFFEQFHVLVTPVVAAKYPPGNALFLASASRLGMPFLGVFACIVAAAILVVELARGCMGWRWGVACLALWVLAPANLKFFPSYFSESLTTPLCLGALVGTLRWRTSHSPRLLGGVGLAFGLIAITRPLTALAWAVPIGCVIVRDLARRADYRALWRPLAAGSLVLLILPLWAWKTLGSPAETPLSRYTRTYMPWDGIGFGLDSTPPLRQTQPDLAELAADFRPVHEAHTLGGLPRTLARRVTALGWDAWGAGGGLIAPFAMLGVVAIPGGWLLAGIVVSALAFYGAYAHHPQWTLYYLEVVPLLVLLAIGGLRSVLMAARRATGTMRLVGLSAAIVSMILFLAAGSVALLQGEAIRRHRSALQSYYQAFADKLATVADGAIVFVRYESSHSVHLSLVRNQPDLQTARVLVAYDRGAENQRLMAMEPGRPAYLYDAGSGQLTRLR